MLVVEIIIILSLIIIITLAFKWLTELNFIL